MKIFISIILSSLLSITVYAQNPIQTTSTNNNDSSIIENISTKSNQLFITTKDQTQHAITLSKKQIDALKQKGKIGLDTLTDIINQYNFQWPIVKKDDTDN